jgi:replicative DNA helicase
MTPVVRPPPASIDAEEQILSACLIDAAGTLARCLSAKVTPLFFTDPQNQVIFAEVLAMHADGSPVAAETLAETLTASGRLALVGGWPKLIAITGKSPTTAQTPFFLERLCETHARREMIQLAAVLTELCHGPSDDDGQISATIARLSAVSAGASGADEMKWPAVVAGAVKHAEGIIAKLPEITSASLAWPWPLFNRVFQPVNPGELVIIAARPSVGKSSITRALCLFHATAGRNVLLESLEDSARSVAFQGAAAGSGVSFTDLPNAHAAEQAEYLAALRGLALPNLHVFSHDTSLAAIGARAKSIHAQTPLAFIAIDQLSHLTDCTPARNENKASAVGRATRAAKRLAMDLEIPVFLLCQLSRQSANDNNREPRLTDLRDSGEIEQDADRVILLHRPDEDSLTGQDQSASEDADDRPRYLVNAIQGKGRSVGAGQIVSLYFTRKTASFAPAVVNKTAAFHP